MRSVDWTQVEASHDGDFQKLPVGEAEFFLDVFNVLDKQSPTGVVANRANSGQYKFQEANAWNTSRRAYLGVRYSF